MKYNLDKPYMRIPLPAKITSFFNYEAGDSFGYRHYLRYGLKYIIEALHDIYGEQIYDPGYHDGSTHDIYLSSYNNRREIELINIIRRTLSVHSTKTIAALAMLTAYYVEKNMGKNPFKITRHAREMRVYTFKATEELMERLYRLARRQGISVGEAIRRAIAQYILAHEPLLVEKVLPI